MPWTHQIFIKPMRATKHYFVDFKSTKHENKPSMDVLFHENKTSMDGLFRGKTKFNK